MTEAADWLLVALGANLGEPLAQLRKARTALDARFASKHALASSIWSSRPVDCPPGSPDFLNAVLVFPVTVAGSALATLSILQALERAFGRDRSALRNAPRTLDLDLLIFGDLLQADPRCVLPHPRALQRRFVMEPAAEVLPDLVWPGTQSTIAEWRDALREDPLQPEIVRSQHQW